MYFDKDQLIVCMSHVERRTFSICVFHVKYYFEPSLRWEIKGEGFALRNGPLIDGRYLLVSMRKGSLDTIDVLSKTIVKSYPQDHRESLSRATVLGPDNAYVVASTFTELVVYDRVSGQVLGAFDRDSPTTVEALLAVPTDPFKLLAAYYDGTIKVWQCHLK
jgi:hypothetical protein